MLVFMLSWPPLWSNGQSSWLQIQRPGFDSRRYQIFWKVVGLERGPLSLVNTTEELLGRKGSGSCLEIRECGLRDSSRWPRCVRLTALSPSVIRLSRQCGILNSVQSHRPLLCENNDIGTVSDFKWRRICFLKILAYPTAWMYVTKNTP
jgi:hypothetical protein